MIEAGVRDSGVIHNTALCHFFAGDFQAAYDLTVRFQAVLRWTADDRYGMATYASRLGKWTEAAWFVMLSIWTGGQFHMFFDMDLVPLWEYAADERLDIKTALALGHPSFAAELKKLSGTSQEIDPIMQKKLPEKFHPCLVHNLENFYPVFGPNAPASIQREFNQWKTNTAMWIETIAHCAAEHSRILIWIKQLDWAIAAAKRGNTYAARWHAQFALAKRPDLVDLFAAKLSRYGMREVMQDLKTVLGRREDFCELLLRMNTVGKGEDKSVMPEILEYGWNTGYEMIARNTEAASECDELGRERSCASLCSRWPYDPTGHANLLQHYAREGNWNAANRVLREAPRSITFFRNFREAATRIARNEKIEEFHLSAKEPFYGQPDIGGLMRYGDLRMVALGPLRRRAEVYPHDLETQPLK